MPDYVSVERDKLEDLLTALDAFLMLASLADELGQNRPLMSDFMDCRRSLADMLEDMQEHVHRQQMLELTTGTHGPA